MADKGSCTYMFYLGRNEFVRLQLLISEIMYHHIKSLMYMVHVGTPDPSFGNMLLEHFGGANGELAAAM